MENEKIDIVEVIANLWSRRKVIFGFVLCFLIAGVALAFLLPRKYTAKCTLGLEIEEQTTRIKVEGMSDFQATSVGEVRSNKIISPAMYPDILFSVPFQKELMYAPLFVNEKGDALTLYDYWTKSGKQRADGEAALRNGVEQLTQQEIKCLEYLKKAITVTLNSKEGNLKISVDMPDGAMAAQVTNQIQLMLQRYIAKFRIDKIQTALDFIEERYQDVKEELGKKQQALIEFRETNKNQNSVRFETEEKILMNDYELFLGLYTDILKQREKARIQVKEDMPVLTVIEPVVEPTTPSQPKRALIIVASLILGFFIGCSWVLMAPLFKQIRGAKTSF